MENNAFNLSSPRNPMVSIKVIPGHFAAGNSHITHYLDMSNLKSSALLARDVANELAIPYLTSTLIDTIVCMEGTEVIGAYLAEELLRDGTFVMNTGDDIHVITPMTNIHGKLFFHSSVHELIRDKNVLMLVASVSTGNTVNRLLECINYYGGHLIGVAALFSANPDSVTHEINAVFTSDEIPNYHHCLPSECEMCKTGHKLDANANSEGYTKI